MQIFDKKDFYKFETIFKGVANHRRLEILLELYNDEQMSTEEIVERLNVHYQTGAHHAQKLVKAGLAFSHREGSVQIYSLTPKASLIISLLKKL